MASEEARAWAYFIVDKLGLPYTKAEIIRCAENMGIAGAWNEFIAKNPAYLELARYNRIDGPSDIGRFFRDASYADMRRTFPSKSHGRTVLGPHIISLRDYEKQKLHKKSEGDRYRVSFAELKQLNDALGKTVLHSAENGVEYGTGVVVAVDSGNGSITVEFEESGRRCLNFKYCLDNGYIRFV